MTSRLLIIFLMLCSNPIFSQVIDCDSLVKIIKYNKKINLKNAIEKELINCGFRLQNEAFMLDEKEGMYLDSHFKIENALIIWQYLKDTLSEANLRKFNGYLLGRLKEFDNAKDELGKAILLYKSKNYYSGVAVSYFDYSRVCEFQNNFDSALIYSNKSIEYWFSQNDSLRILSVANQIINVLILKNDTADFVKVVDKYSPFAVNQNIYWYYRLDFFFLCNRGYKKFNMDNKAKDMLLNYNSIVDKLKKVGKEVPKSHYSD